MVFVDTAPKPWISHGCTGQMDTPMDTANPYQTPKSRPRLPKYRPVRIRWWLVAFLLNLPWWFEEGLKFVQGTAVGGLVFGVLVLGALGWRTCKAKPDLAGYYTAGTLAVAVGQLWPILQTFGVVFGWVIVGALRPSTPPLLDDGNDEILVTFIDAFFVTLLSGGFLGFAAMILAAFFRLVDSKIPRTYAWNARG